MTTAFLIQNWLSEQFSGKYSVEHHIPSTKSMLTIRTFIEGSHYRRSTFQIRCEFKLNCIHVHYTTVQIRKVLPTPDYVSDDKQVAALLYSDPLFFLRLGDVIQQYLSPDV